MSSAGLLLWFSSAIWWVPAACWKPQWCSLIVLSWSCVMNTAVVHVFASIMHFWLIAQDFWSRFFSIRCKKYNRIVSSSQILIIKFWLLCLAFNVESCLLLSDSDVLLFWIEISSLCVLIMAQRVLTLIRHGNKSVGYNKVKAESKWRQAVSVASHRSITHLLAGWV